MVSAIGRTAMRLAYRMVRKIRFMFVKVTHVFDVWTWVHRDNITMLDSKVVTDDSVHTRTSVIKIIVSQHDQDRVLSLFALD